MLVCYVVISSFANKARSVLETGRAAATQVALMRWTDALVRAANSTANYHRRRQSEPSTSERPNSGLPDALPPPRALPRKFSKQPAYDSPPNDQGDPSAPPTDNLPKRRRARGSSAQLPGSPWRRARCRCAPREGQPVVGVERPNGPLRRAYEASSPSSRARALSHNSKLSPEPAPRVLQAAHAGISRVGQPQPWRNQSPRPSTTASIN